jgi:hypothetical protein
MRKQAPTCYCRVYTLVAPLSHRYDDLLPSSVTEQNDERVMHDSPMSPSRFGSGSNEHVPSFPRDGDRSPNKPEQIPQLENRQEQHPGEWCPVQDRVFFQGNIPSNSARTFYLTCERNLLST